MNSGKKYRLLLQGVLVTLSTYNTMRPFISLFLTLKKIKIERLTVQLNSKMLSIIEYLLYYGDGLKKLLVSNNYPSVLISLSFEISNKQFLT